MTRDQERHLQSIKDEFLKRVDQKYRKGQKEHGGNLFDYARLDLVENTIDEAIDMVTYLLSLRRQMLSTMPEAMLPGIVEE